MLSNSCNYGALCENGHYFILQKTQYCPKKNHRIHISSSFLFLISPYPCFVLYLYARYNSFHMRMPLKISYICSICRSYNSFVTHIRRSG
jgi:hypothetical protein